MNPKIKSTIKMEKVSNYTHFFVMPFKMIGFWEWFPKTTKTNKIIINGMYLGMILFTFSYIATLLFVNVYTEWISLLDGIEKMADGLPLVVSFFIVAYFSKNTSKLNELTVYMNENFKFRSAKGLSNMTMWQCYKTAKRFAYVYTAYAMFCVTMYVTLPVIVHLWTKQPLQKWVYMDCTETPYFVIAFLRQALAQVFVALAIGQLTIFFAANSMLICGQLDLLCCSVRNARYTALLHSGIQHGAIALAHADIQNDELHHYAYNSAEIEDSEYHYDEKMVDNFSNKRIKFDIYSAEFDDETSGALLDCARVSQIINSYKKKFERLVSPLLVLRVVQSCLYFCTLLYAASVKFDMVTVEYLGAASLDMFVYCYYGNQIISQQNRCLAYLHGQADRVSTAAYQSAWPAMGVRPRKLLLNILLANRKPVVVRAGNFLPMNLNTFIGIIKTSFSYYTLLVNMNDKKQN